MARILASLRVVLRNFLIFFLCAIFLIFSPFGVDAAIASTIPGIIGKPVSVTAKNGTPVTGNLFDFSQMTIADLPDVEVTDSLLNSLNQISPNTDKSNLIPGSRVGAEEYLTVGGLSFEAFGLDRLSMSDIAARTGTDLGGTNLAQYGDFVGLITPNILVEAIPGLANLPVKEIPAILGLSNVLASAPVLSAIPEAGKLIGSVNNTLQAIQNFPGIGGFVGSMLGGDSSSFINDALGIANLSVGEALTQFADLGELQLGNIGLETLQHFGLASLPGLSETLLGDIATAPEALLKDLIPTGLVEKLQFAKYPFPPELTEFARIMLIDVPLGDVEENRTQVVSGGVPAPGGLNAEPCTGSDCPHVEVTDVVTGQYSGHAWMTAAQKVSDGFGPLCLPFGCKGPAGNHPFGRGFRVLFGNIDEAAGTVEVRISFRGCKKFPIYTCTPYVFPTPEGVPIAVLPEKSLFAFAPPGGADLGGQDWNYPGSVPGDRGGTRPGGCSAGGAGTVSGDAVNRAVQASSMQSSGDYSAAGAQSIPYILAAAQKHGMTDPAQIAYALATAQAESSMGQAMFENTSFSQSGEAGAYHGRGFIQITWQEAYSRVGNMIGVDLLNNPDRASEPEIAAEILVRGLQEGWFGHQRPLSDFVNSAEGRRDYYHARQIVNSLDRADEIAQSAQIYEQALTGADMSTLQANGEGTPPTGCNAQPKPCPPGQKCLLHNPLPSGKVFGLFGTNRGTHMHEGVDMQSSNGYDSFPTGPGDEILAAYDGVVNEYTPVGGKCGGIISIMHPDLGLETRYLHMVKLLVGAGEQVKRGQPIGLEGNETPDICSKGVHLHYEIRPGGGAPVDPLTYEHEPPLR
jgi:murein DD-endopeptidase MepM/ murein hydrolase activator NlpD